MQANFCKIIIQELVINIRDLLNSFKFAISGLKVVFKEEQSFRIQVLIGTLVVFLMFVFPLTILEKAILLLVISAVLSLELINSQMERFLDIIEPRHHPKVERIKDISAAAVLIATLGSVIVGIFIFSPYFIVLF